MTFYYGSHVSTYKGIINSIKIMKSLKGNFLQIFLSNPRGVGMKHYSLADIQEIKQTLIKHKMKIVIHSPYILNFARPFNKNEWWIKSLIKEMKISSKFNSHGSVLHLGKKNCTIKSVKKSLCEKTAYDNMYKSIKYVLSKTPKDSRIILETSTGQGSELGYKLDEFAKFYKRLKDERVKICIDTCHVFVAGYNIKDKKNVLNFFKLINEKFGLENVVLIHLNDSKKEIGSRVDRHASLGEGYIGLKGLKHVIKLSKKLNIPIILETPENHKKEIEIIRKS